MGNIKLEFLASDKAPKAVGPYSQGTKFGDIIISSGQIPLDPVTGEPIKELKAATNLVLSNLLAVVEAGGGCKESIAKVDVFLKDLKDFDEFNEAYIEFFGEHRPARVLVQAGDLAEGALLEAAVTAFAVK